MIKWQCFNILSYQTFESTLCKKISKNENKNSDIVLLVGIRKCKKFQSQCVRKSRMEAHIGIRLHGTAPPIKFSAPRAPCWLPHSQSVSWTKGSSSIADEELALISSENCVSRSPTAFNLFPYIPLAHGRNWRINASKNGEAGIYLHVTLGEIILGLWRISSQPLLRAN